MRRIRLTVLLLAGIVAGCASAQTTSNSAQPHTVTIDEACGTPPLWPVPQKCVEMLGYPYGPLAQRKSDLLMAVWRACPSADPCTPVINSTPACQELSNLKYGSPRYQDAASECGKAQDGDYTCNTVKKDPEYRHRDFATIECIEKNDRDPACAYPAGAPPAGGPERKRWNAADQRALACEDRCWPQDADPDCKQAQTALADFQDRVKNAMLDAQLKAAFAPPEPLVAPYQPPPTVIIQQQPVRAPAFPTQTTCMPFGKGVTCNSW